MIRNLTCNGMLVVMTLCVMASCKKEIATPSSTPINAFKISSPQIGQSSSYLGYTGGCSSVEGDFILNGDTLILEVVQTTSGMSLHEYFSSGSTNADRDPVTHLIVDNGTHVLIPDRFQSYLFFFYGNDTIWNAPIHDFEVTLESCYMVDENGDLFIGNDIAHVQDLNLSVSQKSDLNVISCVPMWGYDAFLAYDDELEVSHSVFYGGIIPQLEGYVLMD